MTTSSQILRKILNKQTDSISLFKEFSSGVSRRQWRAEPRLYRELSSRLIREDHPHLALDLIEGGLHDHPHDLDLKFRHALANSRPGSRQQCRENLDALVQEVDDHCRIGARILCLAGRMLKDEIEEVIDDEQRKDLAQQSAAFYRRARQLHDSSFETINAATMSALAGDDDTARTLAEAALVHIENEADNGQQDSYWIDAVRGEASLILGRRSDAIACYQKAVSQASSRLGDIASMRRNVELLKARFGDLPEILQLFATGSLVVFAGHMVDPPSSRPEPTSMRFPDDDRLVDAVKQTIRDRLDELQAVIGYCSGACGSDILFAESLLERGAELHVVLPFDKSDFVTTSVDCGFDAMSHWRERFEAVLQRAEVHFATTELYLGDDELFAFSSRFMQGLALTHSRRLQIEPVGLVVLDPHAKRKEGGTAKFVDEWDDLECRCDKIDLSRVRDSIENVRPKVSLQEVGPPDRRVTEAQIRRGEVLKVSGTGHSLILGL